MRQTGTTAPRGNGEQERTDTWIMHSVGSGGDDRRQGDPRRARDERLLVGIEGMMTRIGTGLLSEGHESDGRCVRDDRAVTEARDLTGAAREDGGLAAG